jgi:hypothetical protein
VLNWEGKDEEGLPQRNKGKGRAVEEEDDERVKQCGKILPIGFDRSEGLLGVAGGRGHEVVKGDCVDLTCWRRGAFVRIYSSPLAAQTRANGEMTSRTTAFPSRLFTISRLLLVGWRASRCAPSPSFS